ncbi:MAG: tyrosine-type recombinase/integrase [Catenulispora sp.]|nr:tyrosine-type recombinase/integrase [Catenulispora sp.]
MAKNNPIFKKCGCRGPVLDPAGTPVLGADGKPKMRRLGAGCPQLRRGTGWNPRHGSWHYQIEVNMGPNADRAHLGRGGLATSDEAEAQITAIRTLVAISEEHADDPEAAAKIRAEIVERIRIALKDRTPLPDAAELRTAAHVGQPIVNKTTVEQWLTDWLDGKGKIVANTKRGYATHVAKYLIPHIGQVPLDKLRVSHVNAMFNAIAEDADIIPAENAARHEVEAAAKKGWKQSDPAMVRAARQKLATMPPYRRPANAATRQRIRATLRSALSAAQREQLITVNVAALAELESGKRPKALVWTDARVRRWQATGEMPSPVMVWTEKQTQAFLARAERHEHYALFQLVAFTGLRRGEACGLRWNDFDLPTRKMTVAQQIVQMGWETAITAPKSDAGARDVGLTAQSVTALKTHRKAQKKAKLAHGPGWIDTDLVFTGPDGSPLHPAWVTDQFKLLLREAGLPPIRLHDLRHGAATLALANGVDIKVVQEMLGHSSATITRDTDTSVVDERPLAAADAIGAALSRTDTAA